MRQPIDIMADKRVKNFEIFCFNLGARVNSKTQGNSKMQTPHGELQEVVAGLPRSMNSKMHDYMFIYTCNNNSYDVPEVEFGRARSK